MGLKRNRNCWIIWSHSWKVIWVLIKKEGSGRSRMRLIWKISLNRLSVDWMNDSTDIIVKIMKSLCIRHLWSLLAWSFSIWVIYLLWLSFYESRFSRKRTILQKSPYFYLPSFSMSFFFYFWSYLQISLWQEGQLFCFYRLTLTS